MNKDNYTYSPNACVFKKSYGVAHLTVIIEEPATDTPKGEKEKVQVLKDEISNFLNDAELEEMFKPKPDR